MKAQKEQKKPTEAGLPIVLEGNAPSLPSVPIFPRQMVQAETTERFPPRAAPWFWTHL
jgi:hypothetical protein